MNKLLRKRIFIISISLAFLLLINIGISYSYYLGKVVGNESGTTLSLTSAGVVITYDNNSGIIDEGNIAPGWSTTKNFTVSSTFNQGSTSLSKLWYVVKICVDNNEFPTGSIEYSLSQNGSVVGNGKAMEVASNIGIATGSNKEGIVLGTGYFVAGVNEHRYTLSIKYVDSDIIVGNKNLSIHLVVETVKPATLTIDANGGTYPGLMVDNIPQGIPVDIKEPTKDYHAFTRWIITSGEGIVEGSKILANSSELTIQAQYDRLPSTITIDVDGGTYSGATTVNTLMGETVDIGAPTKTNYTFSGWKIISGTGTVSGNKITPTSATLSLQAQYTKAPATITIDANGGTYSGSTIINTSMGETVDIGSAIKSGYTFTGWKITSGTGTVSGNKITIKTTTLTVQAQYVIQSFATDSWATIAANVRAGNASGYNVSDTKEIAVTGRTNGESGSNGLYTVRVANNSNYNCTLESKTACGFVVEFADIVEKRVFNSTLTNVGGWPSSTIRTYLNGDFLNLLPSDLQSVIVNTTVVSGHGSGDSSNLASTDKIYLLSTKEIYVDGGSNNISSGDSAYNSTRQLDHYVKLGVTTVAYAKSKKYYNGSATSWYTRTPSSSGTTIIYAVDYNGDWFGSHPTTEYGIAPAFHIG